MLAKGRTDEIAVRERPCERHREIPPAAPEVDDHKALRPLALRAGSRCGREDCAEDEDEALDLGAFAEHPHRLLAALSLLPGGMAQMFKRRDTENSEIERRETESAGSSPPSPSCLDACVYIY